MFTTYRLTEHHTAGGMSRTLGYLSELQPEMFCEVSPELARLRGLVNGGWATIVTSRAAIEARVLVTDRMRPLRVAGQVVHQVGLPYHWGSNGLATGDGANDLLPIVGDPNVHIMESKANTCDVLPGRRPRGPALVELVEGHRARALAEERGAMTAGPRMGFFTDTSVCIGCKACEVACKEWNLVPEDGPLRLTGDSYDNTGALGASTWRHVAFVEQQRDDQGLRWLMSSDVCKHCSSAACLEVCPTGALFRTEFSTVVVQPDICNGCGYCVPACPFGVIDRREDDGRAFKCTLCYDRLRDGLQPACATACPTDSIQFGELGELRERARERVATLHDAGVAEARLYLEDDDDGIGGAGAFFLLLDEPEVYGLPPDPVSTTRDLPTLWRAAALAAGTLLAAVAVSFVGGRR